MQPRSQIGVHTQWLLLQEQEAGVDQLQKLGEVVKLCLSVEFSSSMQRKHLRSRE
jgi:hypothetical protein